MFTERLLRAGAAALLAAATAVAAAAAEPGLELELGTSSARVGDRVEVTASAAGGENLLWAEPEVSVDPVGDWALVDPPAPVPGTRPPVWRLTLAPLALGELELPAITVSARDPDGGTVEVRAADPPKLEVVSVLDPEQEASEPAPLRDPIGVRGFPWEWVLPIVGVLLPLLGGAAWWWRGRGREVAAGRRPSLPPLAELEALAGDLRGRVGREPADGICDRLAAGLRRYLGRRTGEPAAEMTSFELRLLARDRGWPEDAQRLVQRVMSVADGVRFGRRAAVDEQLRGAIGHALDAARSLEAFLAEAEREPGSVEVAS